MSYKKHIKPIKSVRNDKAVPYPKDLMNMGTGELREKLHALTQAQNSVGGGYPLNGLVGFPAGNMSPMSQPWTIADSNNYVPLTLDRILLTFAYMTHGIFQTAIDQPVYDGYKGGIIINSPDLDEADIQLLQEHIRDNRTLHEVRDAQRWARLYGGAGLIINTTQNGDTDRQYPLRREFMDYPDTPLSFVAADRWELTMSIVNFQDVEFPYNYYGTPLPKDRVLRIIGKEAPSFVRPQLMGWGFSDLERMIRELNAYVRANESLFQMLKEWNIDVWQLVGFNDTILSDLAQGKVNKRIMYANYLKSTTNSIMMDAEDKFEQRTQTFSGVGEVFQQIRLGTCGALRMPMSKVFGFAASGLNSNQDDMENYNAMIEAEIREPAIPILHDVVGLSCRQLFGYEPELTISFKPLRELDAVEEEEVKTSKQTRLFQFYTAGLLSPQETMESAKKQELHMEDSKVLHGADPEPPMMQQMEDDPVAGPKKKEKDA
jgi:phage-related protein (TIGR01555 family)